MGRRKYEVPAFLVGQLTQDQYQRWLGHRATAHCKRDRERGNSSATREGYMLAIHKAVQSSAGLDAYTGKPLRWDLISTYDNAASKAGGRVYKQTYGDLPTVDHVGDGLGAAEFEICAWRTNDCKTDLSHAEFVELCRSVVKHADDSSASYSHQAIEDQA